MSTPIPIYDILVKDSLRQKLVSLFTDEDLWTQPWHIYGAADWRSATHTPTFPWLYLIEMPQRYEIARLPVVAINVLGGSPYDFALGEPDVFDTQILIHVLGRDSVQRDTLAGAISQTVREFSIVDSAGAQATNSRGENIVCALNPYRNRNWAVETMPGVPDAQTFEGTAVYWKSLSTSLLVR